MTLPEASVVVATYNRQDVLESALEGMATQDYPTDYEIIVVNDGSTDNTADVVHEAQEKYDNIIYFEQENSGPNVAKNRGFEKANYPVVVVMDDDCIPEEDWLRKLVSHLDEKVAGVSSYTPHGGTSTAFRKDVLDEIGYFDLDFNEFNLRDDTDLVFRLRDAGYEFKFVDDARFDHRHTPTADNKVSYALGRVWKHQADVLLYKKHPHQSKDFLDIQFGCIRNPLEDFKIATGLWNDKLELSSPQGITFLENKSILHEVMIVAMGIAYAVMVKLARLYGSFRFRKLLL